MDKICVLGLGYIGLPTAAILATHGFHVVGVDIDPQKVACVNEGSTYIHEPGLRTLLKSAVQSGNLCASLDVDPADVFIICVPTPVLEDCKPDLRYLVTAAESIVPHLQTGNLVIVESTCPPGTTEHVVGRIFEKTGLSVGRDLFLAYCPERVLPGHVLKELLENDRIIGGVTPRCAARARQVYERFVDGSVHLTDAKTAELVKLVENTFRMVNIALANELALICEEVSANVWDVIRLANRHPRVSLHLPGPGVGGHCIPIDPWFIVATTPFQSKLIRQSAEINKHITDYVVQRIVAWLSDIETPNLGASYKANVDDVRESPTLRIVQGLQEAGISVRVYDPNVKGNTEIDISPLEVTLRDADMLLLAVDHSEFKYLHPVKTAALMRRLRLFDTRNFLDSQDWLRAGFEVEVIGVGARRQSSSAAERWSEVAATGGADQGLLSLVVDDMSEE